MQMAEVEPYDYSGFEDANEDESGGSGQIKEE